MIKHPYILIALLCFCTSSMATGYIGISGGIADYGLDRVSDFDKSTSLEIIAGIAPSESFALEISYLDFGEAEDTTPPLAQINRDAITIGGLFKEPASKNLDFILNLGFYKWDEELTQDGSGVLFQHGGVDIFYGFGLETKSLGPFSLGARYIVYDAYKEDRTIFSVNLLIGF